jgi:integrase
MARPTSSGLRYLVQRKESGGWTYHRAFAAELVPFLDGEVRLGWTGKVVSLQRAKAFKASLATTDPDTARDRWAKVHTEVQRIVEVAGQRLAESREAQRRPLARRTSLTPDERQAVADQAKYDILAQHDLEAVDPEARNPLAEILASLVQAGNQPLDQLLDKARHLAHRMQRDDAKRALKRGGQAIADRKIVLRKVNTKDGLEDRSEIVQTIRPEIDERLTENGVHLENEKERKLAQLAMRRARLAAHDAILERDKGANIPTPVRPPLIVPDANEDPVPTLSEMLQIWRKRKNPDDKSWSDRALYVNRFIQAYGDLRVDEIKKKHIREFRDLHMEVPKSVPHRLRGASPNELIAYGKQHPEIAKLAWHTINTKAIGSLQAILRLAVTEGYCEVNAASDMHLDRERDPKKSERLPFSPEQVCQLFAAPEFTSGKPLSPGGCGEAGYWLPILSGYTGARVEELAQLEVADIKQDYGHDYLDITIIDNAPDRKKDPIAHAKSLKNANARREVPLHPDLITLGFLEYVEEMRRLGKRRVFPMLQAYRGRRAKNIGRWLNRLIDKRVTDRPEFTFHSFRHVLASELRNRAPQAGVLDKVVNGLVGHAGGDTSDRYGLPHALKTRQHAVNLFGIEGLELSKFKRPGSGY